MLASALAQAVPEYSKNKAINKDKIETATRREKRKIFEIILYLLLLLLYLFHEYRSLFILASLVLEPDSNHPGAEARHLRQLLLHQGVRPGVGVVARP